MTVPPNHPPKNIHAQIEALLRPLLALTLPASAFPVIFSTDRLVYFRGAFTDLPLRLFVDGLAYLLCLGFAISVLMPATALSALNRVRGTFRVKGELS